MIAESLKDQIVALSPDNRRELMGFMVCLEIKDSTNYRKTLTERIDDNNPDNWVNLDELDAKLNAIEDE